MENDKLVSVDLKRDIKAITKLTYDYLESTYIDDVSSRINTYRSFNEEKPSKEIEFIRAILPLIEDDSMKKVLVELTNQIINSQTITQLLTIYNPEENLEKIIYGVFLYKIILILEDHNKI